MGSRAALILAIAVGSFVFWQHNWLERDMARHMVIEFPLLLFTGAFIAHALETRFAPILTSCNPMGIVGFTFAASTLTYWMIPAALDAALLNEYVAAGKYVTLLLSGALLWGSFRAAPLPVQAFFVGTCVSMTATFGIVYQSAPQQLCLNYLPDAQVLAGEGLVAAGVIAGCVWCASAARGFLQA
jgi:hypothetical protein